MFNNHLSINLISFLFFDEIVICLPGGFGGRSYYNPLLIANGTPVPGKSTTSSSNYSLLGPSVLFFFFFGYKAAVFYTI